MGEVKRHDTKAIRELARRDCLPQGCHRHGRRATVGMLLVDHSNHKESYFDFEDRVWTPATPAAPQQSPA
ncbi:hypothetical protein [Streptomyces sp. NPDC006551]|uniref:hypothetical protein n=1 Tax=Streptomyces sp. NPDC006551 TaxID=3157178 RepID=UPI0033B6D493